MKRKKTEGWSSGQLDGIRYIKNPLFGILVLQELEIENLLKSRFTFPRKSDIWSDFLGEEVYWNREFDSIPEFRKNIDRKYGFISSRIREIIREQLEDYLKEIQRQFKYNAGDFFKILEVKPLDESNLP